jgi:hypothetical protein
MPVIRDRRQRHGEIDIEARLPVTGVELAEVVETVDYGFGELDAAG